MEREIINETNAEEIVGGSIVFNADFSACGHNRNDQYKVRDYAAVDAYIKANCLKMTERKMLANMVDAGLLEEL